MASEVKAGETAAMGTMENKEIVGKTSHVSGVRWRVNQVSTCVDEEIEDGRWQWLQIEMRERWTLDVFVVPFLLDGEAQQRAGVQKPIAAKLCIEEGWCCQ